MKRGISLLFCLIMASITQQASTESIGIVINYELGSSVRLLDYINGFYQPFCNTVAQFNVIVSAQATKQITQVRKSLQPLQKIIPIHYIFTSQGEHFHYKLKIDKDSKAEFYYVSSMDKSNQGCQNMQKLILSIEQKSVGGLIGLIGQHDSLSSVTSDLTKIKNQFAYTKQTPQHYAIVQNIRIFSKHILQLSYSNIPEVVKMRRQTTPICEQLFLNFVISHFYPELRPSFEVFNTSLKKEAMQDSLKIKSKCLRAYIDILGYLPLFYHRKEFTKALWVNPNQSKIVLLKKFQLVGELEKGKQADRRLLNSPGAITLQKDFQEQNNLAANQKQKILQVLRIIIAALLIIVLGLCIQCIMISMQVKTKRQQ